MTHRTHHAITHCTVLKHAVFLFALLTSVNALAETQVSPVDNAMVTNTSVDPYEAIKWRNSTSNKAVAQGAIHKNSRFRTYSDIRRTDTGKVFKDDYERVLTTVGSAKNTEMIWLRE